MEFDGRLNTTLMKLRAPLNDKSENPIFLGRCRGEAIDSSRPIGSGLASHGMWPEPPCGQCGDNAYGTSRSGGKVTDGTRIPLVRDVIAGRRMRTSWH